MQRLSNNQQITVDYFVCKKGDSNTDCAQLKKNFKNMTEKTVTTDNKDAYYKLADLTSRFVTNDLFGYFINDIPDTEVENMIKYIVLPNPNYVKETVAGMIPLLCTDGVMTLEETTSTSLTLENNKVTLNAVGMINDIKAECTIHIDPSLPNLGEQTNFHYSEVEVEEETPTTATTSKPLDVNDVEQFPINLEKTFEFTSSR
ncbi:hypothetical protein KKG31_08025 [Patescibacteria group bacterium]|nr:hypothetical protein [Patescibacteria group bacterium]MBU1759010.1 hypothetical protein [Patescibacteria group bacterium]